MVIGSTLPVEFAKTGTQRLTVRAIYNEQALAGQYVISLATYRANFDDLTDGLILVKAEPGQAEKVRPGLEAVLKRYPQGSCRMPQFKAAQAKQFSQIVNLIYALLLMAIIIAVFGIAITLALSIFERTHEIGLLRAVGMSSGQVWATVQWEAGDHRAVRHAARVRDRGVLRVGARAGAQGSGHRPVQRSRRFGC